MYEDLGVSRAVYAYGEKILEDLKPRFAGIDRNAEYNQAKVLHAMQENRVDATCFAATTGYGYDDLGRDKLEKVYAATFHTEAALVRPQITCGTHALASPSARSRSTASATGRSICSRTDLLIMTASARRSRKRRSSSPSSARRGTRQDRRSPCRKSASSSRSASLSSRV